MDEIKRKKEIRPQKRKIGSQGNYRISGRFCQKHGREKSKKGVALSSSRAVPTCDLLVLSALNTFRMAFLNGYNGLAIVGGEEFTVGIDNFKTVINHVDFKLYLKNTVLLCVLTCRSQRSLRCYRRCAQLDQAASKVFQTCVLPALRHELDRDRHGVQR
jgi:hypothetical protein